MEDSTYKKRPFVPIRARGDSEQLLSEKQIEKKLVEMVKRAGGKALKFVSPGWDGVPDRIVLMPSGKIAFVELKSPGKKMRPLQLRRKRQLEVLGFKVFCVDGVGEIPGVVEEIKGGDAR